MTHGPHFTARRGARQPAGREPRLVRLLLVLLELLGLEPSGPDDRVYPVVQVRPEVLADHPWLGEIDGDWWVESPDGQVSRIAPQEDGVPVFSESRIPGVYALFTTPAQAGSEDNKANPAGLKLPPNAHPAGGFTVNVDTRESIPDKIGEAAVHDILRGAPVEISRQTETLQTVKTDGGFSMVMPFLLAMAVMMCAEGWLVRKE